MDKINTHTSNLSSDKKKPFVCNEQTKDNK